ncbi:protein maelstrom homolog isoform X4 [Manis pentadactyla]|uniref:protein maelstrom homolog isoform X4 n=1 Tax=Manis pentadactyla TaxID=143292 RepID=UPI00255CD02F|nr:protein maelstrom homolog isoform X4 [Manis pentadactyla]
MPNRKASRNAFYFFVQEKMPELRRQGLSVARVADAIPYCSSDWMLLREEEKEKYTEMAREWRAARGKDPGPAKNQRPVSTPLVGPSTLVPRENVSLPDVSSLSLKNDQALLGGIFYFLNIFSHGELPPHCQQRFLPCEIGCVKYSLQEGIVADFHSFINPGEIPRGFRFHCQAASDSSHKIPISNFEFGYDQATVLENLYRFIHTNSGGWPPIYCKSNDRARVNWCLKQMAKASQEIRQNLELLTVEDLVVEIYQQKFLKEPSKTWVRSLLDVAMWDYSSNTRYCISNSLATLFGIQLTEAHIPLQDYEASGSVTPKMVVLDAGRYQKLRVESPGFSNFRSPNPEQRADTPTGDYPSGVNISSQSSHVRGRGITRLLESISSSSSNSH